MFKSISLICLVSALSFNANAACVVNNYLTAGGMVGVNDGIEDCLNGVISCKLSSTTLVSRDLAEKDFGFVLSAAADGTNSVIGLGVPDAGRGPKNTILTITGLPQSVTLEQALVMVYSNLEISYIGQKARLDYGCVVASDATGE